MAKIVIPTESAQLEELLGDQSKVQNLMAEGQFSDVVKAYAKSVGQSDDTIGRQVKEETQRVLAEYLRENENEAGLKALRRAALTPPPVPATSPSTTPRPSAAP